MDVRVDFERLEVGQRPREGDLLILIGDLAPKRDERRLGLGADPGEEGRQGQAAGQRALDIIARLLGPFGMIEPLELVGEIGQDPRGELVDLGVVDLLGDFGR